MSLVGVMGSILARNARGVGSNATLGAIFLIFTPTPTAQILAENMDK